MSAAAPKTAVLAVDPTQADAAAHDAYICRRVVDTLLRENVRECMSRAVARTGNSLPSALAHHRGTGCAWLEVSHFGAGRLWIPVAESTFMQAWRSAEFPLLWDDGRRLKQLYAVEDILACFSQGLSAAAMNRFEAFAEECRVAAGHRHISESERERWFAEFRTMPGMTAGTRLPNWQSRLLHYDRLGAFLDHPFYPTARAKLGFDADALAAYGPEFQRPFVLRWLAVPRGLYHPSADAESTLPALWPSVEAVGLPAAMAGTHALIPVHPFVWDHQLDEFLRDAELRESVVRAPHSYLAVAPTLSVRTVVLLDAPEWHLKLPLTIRTLGAKNIRTIKPSTIHDGHRFQTLLADIAAREPAMADRLLLTFEACGGHVDNQMFLGHILRRYPVEALGESTLIPVAALLAQAPSGHTVAEEAAAEFYGGDLEAFFEDYLELTLRLHLTLWLRYGVALESNQQNSVLVFNRQAPRLRLLLKDNDAGRIHFDELARRWPDLARRVADLQDRRIFVADALPLAQMFTTITLQLNIAVLAEGYAGRLGVPATALYARVRRRVEAVLDELAAAGEDVAPARHLLLEDDRLYIKYLLIAATLAEKTETGAADVNKFYGRSAPNFLRAT
jgi:siderophore synthetase component